MLPGAVRDNESIAAAAAAQSATRYHVTQINTGEVKCTGSKKKSKKGKKIKKALSP